jgi:trehalose 6-phosphate phosphatase
MKAVGLREVENTVLQRIAAAERLFCFLDYDGTLSPLAPTPDAATPLAGTVARLQALAVLPGTQVALVTGRTISDLRRYLDVPDIYYVGVHGLQIRSPNGVAQLSERAAVVRSVLPAIKRQIERALVDRPGILIEDKEMALACHYRLASRVDAATARQTVAAVARNYQRHGVHITVTHGHEVIEIRPASANKGKAVCQLLAAHGRSALAVYIGDDQTDEDAFALLPEESITIRVGPATTPTAAHYRVPEPDDVLRFLGAMADSRCRR